MEEITREHIEERRKSLEEDERGLRSFSIFPLIGVAGAAYLGARYFMGADIPGIIGSKEPEGFLENLDGFALGLQLLYTLSCGIPYLLFTHENRLVGIKLDGLEEQLDSEGEKEVRK